LSGQGASVEICPQAIAQTNRFDDQRIALPTSGGVAIPGWLRILGQRSAVGEDLPELHVALVENDDEAGRLQDLFRQRVRKHLKRAKRQTSRVRVVFRLVTFSLRRERGRPGLKRRRPAHAERQIEEHRFRCRAKPLAARRTISIVLPDT
jgi:hypothetical protein